MAIKGYKVFDLNTKSILISRDIVFHEDVFPYKTTTYPSVANDVPNHTSNFVFPLAIPDFSSDPLISHAPLVPTTTIPASASNSAPGFVSAPDYATIFVAPPRKSSRLK